MGHYIKHTCRTAVTYSTYIAAFSVECKDNYKRNILKQQVSTRAWTNVGF